MPPNRFEVARHVPCLRHWRVVLIWDVGYFFSAEAFTGRDAKGALDIITVGRQYMSWYMAFFGIFFGLLLTGDAEKLKSFLQLAAKAHVSLVVLLSPFLFVALSGLFIPIQIKATANSDAPSSALKALFMVVTFAQKSATFLLAHCIGRLVLAVGR